MSFTPRASLPRRESDTLRGSIRFTKSTVFFTSSLLLTFSLVFRCFAVLLCKKYYNITRCTIFIRCSAPLCADLCSVLQIFTELKITLTPVGNFTLFVLLLVLPMRVCTGRLIAASGVVEI